jgi:hypothetical protein
MANNVVHIAKRSDKTVTYITIHSMPSLLPLFAREGFGPEMVTQSSKSRISLLRMYQNKVHIRQHAVHTLPLLGPGFTFEDSTVIFPFAIAFSL